MRRCITCEGLLDESAFPGDGPVCKTCVGKLNAFYDVAYSPPERKTRNQAVVELIAAIKARAVEDEETGKWTALDRLVGGPLAAWNLTWVESEPWSTIWTMFEGENSTMSVFESGIRI